MFRALLSSRLIQVGLVFFIVVVGGHLLYSWQIGRATVAEFTQTDAVPHETRSEQAIVQARWHICPHYEVFDVFYRLGPRKSAKTSEQTLTDLFSSSRYDIVL